MAGSTFGKLFKITTWGESHGAGLGVVIDGCPSGVPISKEDIQKDLNKRKPGTSRFSTSRKEGDEVEILSGVLKGISTGTPISLFIRNMNQKSKDYSDLENVFRPGHADYTYEKKYGIRDVRGGGRSSGRETVARVAAGAIAKKILSTMNISICTYTLSIGEVDIDKANFDESLIWNTPLRMPDHVASQKAAALLDDMRALHDSVGGVVECVVKGVPSGIGEPVFDKLDAILAQAVMSIGGTKGVEFGSGFDSASMYGSCHNDEWYYDENNNMQKSTNHAGGILGGISDGSDIVFRTVFKPTPSISKEQHTVNKDKSNVALKITGRHDPIIVPRAVIVVEAMTSLVLVDYLFSRILSNMTMVKKAYS